MSKDVERAPTLSLQNNLVGTSIATRAFSCMKFHLEGWELTNSSTWKEKSTYKSAVILCHPFEGSNMVKNSSKPQETQVFLAGSLAMIPLKHKTPQGHLYRNMMKLGYFSPQTF